MQPNILCLCSFAINHSLRLNRVPETEKAVEKLVYILLHNSNDNKNKGKSENAGWKKKKDIIFFF